MKESFKKKLVRSRLTWARHVERMGRENLAEGADAQKVEGNKEAWKTETGGLCEDRPGQNERGLENENNKQELETGGREMIQRK